MAFQLVLAFLLACILCGVLTAAMCRWGPRIGLVDHPDEFRKAHQRPTPHAGGLAIYLATTATLCGALLIPSLLRTSFLESGTNLAALFSGVTVIVAIGLIDDRFGLRGRQKLFGQTVASLFVVGGGLIVRQIDLFGWQIELGMLSIPVTLVWLLGAINSLNLLDGLDGLVSTIGFILVATVALIATRTGHMGVVVVAVVFAGSLVGFLWFNLPPARIFLGDTGSMLIGLLVGTLAISGSFKAAGTVLLAAPMALWTIPIVDCAAAILRRKLTGQSIYTVDHGHLHHRLKARFGSNNAVLAWVGTACVTTCAAGLLSVFLKNDLVALLTSTGIVMVFILSNAFGRMEAMLVLNRLWHVGTSIFRPALSNRSDASHSSVASRLQGTADWAVFWEEVTDAAALIELDEVRLDVHLPIVGESFNAVMRPQHRDMAERQWRLSVPLIAGDHTIGRIVLAAPLSVEASVQSIERSLLLVEQVQERVPLLCGFDKFRRVAEQAGCTDSYAQLDKLPYFASRVADLPPATIHKVVDLEHSEGDVRNQFARRVLK